MLLKITATHQPATDLGYLLHKHPDRFQTKELSFGPAHVFYPEATEERCTAVLLLEINSVELTRNAMRNISKSFNLAHYVNDRPYVASSFLSTAIAKVYGSALNGNCKELPELAVTPLPLVAEVAAVRSPGGAEAIRRVFEPLGYEVEIKGEPLDEQFPGWGESPYFHLILRQTIVLSQLLTHLYVLLPALDNNKHYYVGVEEVDKLLAKGADWLADHPEKEWIARRYLKHKRSYTRLALEQLVGEAAVDEEEESETAEEALEKSLRVHELRHQAVIEKLKESGARTVADLGCSSGKLLRLLMRERPFDKIIGMDISYRSLEQAKERLYFDQMTPKKRERIELIHGALTYRDPRLENLDAAVLVEVIEHLEPDRLEAFEKVLFQCARPKQVIITTPNGEYNALFENLPAGRFRHSDHRFEWSRAEFRAWGDRVAERYGYAVAYFPIGPEHEAYGALSQMAVFVAAASAAVILKPGD